MNRRWLAPLTPLYAAGLALRNRRIEDGSEPVRRLSWPVISIGNLSTGGAGKTPTTIALAKALAQRGLRVDVLSRGYGRQSRLPVRVDPAGTAEDFGDEPLLIAQEAGVPVYVARQRFDAGLLAESDISAASLSTVHLLDDGFQHRQLHRDVNILLAGCQDWQDRLLPAGNLREPLLAARRADLIAIPANEPEFAAELRGWGWQGPVWRLNRKMEVPAADGPVVAFCGIARPEQFFAGLEAAGTHIAARIAFADHHRCTAGDLGRLVAAVRQTDATALITTGKDRVRLGELASALPESLPLLTAGLRVQIESEDQAVEWLAGRLWPAPVHPPL
jgi:tetraacyldisaccharide 4'-kinase